MQRRPLRLLVWDTRYEFNEERVYDTLVERGITIVRLEELEELARQNLEEVDGFIAHPGWQNQKEFYQAMKKYPHLKTVIITSDEGKPYAQEGNIAISYPNSPWIEAYFTEGQE